MVKKEISIKGLIALYNSGELDEKELRKDLDSYEKSDLITYIMNDESINNQDRDDLEDGF
jgi:hypothetical protein